jgi:hypothetical protein
MVDSGFRQSSYNGAVTLEKIYNPNGIVRAYADAVLTIIVAAKISLVAQYYIV